MSTETDTPVETATTEAPKVKKDHTAQKQIAKYIVTRVALGVGIHFATEALIKAIDKKTASKNDTPTEQ